MSGRHKKVRETSMAVASRSVAMSLSLGVALTVTGGLQIVNATVSSAAATPFNNYHPLRPAADGHLYYQFDQNIEQAAREALITAFDTWNKQLGYDLFRVSSSGQPAQVKVHMGKFHDAKARGGPDGDVVLSEDYFTEAGIKRQWDTYTGSLFHSYEEFRKSRIGVGNVHTTTHELGHVLGLKHPSEAAGSELMIGDGTEKIDGIPAGEWVGSDANDRTLLGPNEGEVDFVRKQYPKPKDASEWAPAPQGWYDRQGFHSPGSGTENGQRGDGAKQANREDSHAGGGIRQTAQGDDVGRWDKWFSSKDDALKEARRLDEMGTLDPTNFTKPETVERMKYLKELLQQEEAGSRSGTENGQEGDGAKQSNQEGSRAEGQQPQHSSGSRQRGSEGRAAQPEEQSTRQRGQSTDGSSRKFVYLSKNRHNVYIRDGGRYVPVSRIDYEGSIPDAKYEPVYLDEERGMVYDRNGAAQPRAQYERENSDDSSRLHDAPLGGDATESNKAFEKATGGKRHVRAASMVSDGIGVNHATGGRIEAGAEREGAMVGRVGKPRVVNEVRGGEAPRGAGMQSKRVEPVGEDVRLTEGREAIRDRVSRRGETSSVIDGGSRVRRSVDSLPGPGRGGFPGVDSARSRDAHRVGSGDPFDRGMDPARRDGSTFARGTERDSADHRGERDRRFTDEA
ncbi:matrixin family metalloprotease [Streptomyces sp. NPDC007205]|uniref:matrixin family metalloprotease n=1 Tax=Streptomyces sp. NPDC007205 TaxID=3154316 RepID=UPI00340579E8